MERHSNLVGWTAGRRSALAGIAVLALALAMLPAWGFYRRETLLAAVIALGCALGACLLPDRVRDHHHSWARLSINIAAGAVIAVGVWHLWMFGNDAVAWVAIGIATIPPVATMANWLPRPRSPQPFLPALALFLSGLGVMTDDLFYLEVPTAQWAIHGAAGIGFLTLVSLITTSADRHWRTHVALLFICGAVLRGGAVIASPDPVIDVYAWLRDAPEALLEGKNPYTIEYPNVYASERARSYGMYEPGPKTYRLPAYPPVPILIAFPFRALGLDVQYANVLCDLLAAAVILAVGTKINDPYTGILAAGTYLLFPGAPFMIEQAWYEPMIAALLGGGLWMIGRGWRAGYILTGLGLTAKQYGIALVWPLLREVGKQWRWLLGGLVVAGLVMLVFFLWVPKDFIDVILRLHLERPTQFDSITLHSGADDLLDVQPPRCLFWAFAGVLVGLMTWRAPRVGPASALWLGTALLCFCLCHTQGYFNYFYLCEYLWLLGLAGAEKTITNAPPPENVKWIQMASERGG